MKKILYISFIIVFALAITALMSFIVYEHGRQKIGDIKINISKNEEHSFLNKKIIRRIVMTYDSVDTIKVHNFKAEELEKIIGKNPFVEHVDAYLGINRDLIINIKEREALLRVFLPDNQSFYIDRNGEIFPLCSYYAPRVLIANGYIKAAPVIYFETVNDSIYAGSDLPELYRLSVEIANRPFLNAAISQIYINSKGNYDLIPELGKHTVKLGSLENMKEKLDHLEAFYKEKLPKEGWDKYKIINLTYKNQIVCIKK